MSYSQNLFVYNFKINEIYMHFDITSYLFNFFNKKIKEIRDILKELARNLLSLALSLTLSLSLSLSLSLIHIYIYNSSRKLYFLDIKY
jgi:hypothetical protein